MSQTRQVYFSEEEPENLFFYLDIRHRAGIEELAIARYVLITQEYPDYSADNHRDVYEFCRERYRRKGDDFYSLPFDQFGETKKAIYEECVKEVKEWFPELTQTSHLNS